MKKFTMLLVVAWFVNQTVLCMEPDERTRGKRPLHFALDEQREIKKPKQLNNEQVRQNDTAIFSELQEKDIPLYNLAYEHAPIKIKIVIEWIRKKMDIGYRNNHMLFVGPQGTGKSLLAQAIAFILGRELLFIRTPTLLGKWRNESLVNVNKLFDRLRAMSPMPLLVFDEIDALTHNYLSSHSDKYDTAMAFWERFDELKVRKDFFLIGTTNNSKDMPPQIQSRFRGKMYGISFPSAAIKKEQIKFHLQRMAVADQIMLECDDNDIELLATHEKMKNYGPRDIITLLDQAFKISQQMEYPNLAKRMISIAHLEAALSELEISDKEFCDFSQRMDPDDRRHEDNKKFQWELHEDSKQHQQTLHDESYYQQRDYHNASMNLQQLYHRESLDAQFDLATRNLTHQDSTIDRNERFARENGDRMADRTEAFTDRMRLHNEKFARQNIDRNEDFTQRNINRSEQFSQEMTAHNEEFCIGTKIADIYANAPGDVMRDLPVVGNMVGAGVKVASGTLTWRAMLNMANRNRVIYGDVANHGQAPRSSQNIPAQRLPYAPINASHQ